MTARRRRAAGWALALATPVLGLTGCGPGASSSGAARTRTPPPPTLSAQAVSYLPSSVRTLTASGLAHEAQAPGLAARLRHWGFVAGSDRYFQGESRRLQIVDSRTLRFRSAGGAGAFVNFMRAHLTPYLGDFPKIRPVASRGRRGIVATASECQCHLANPALLGVLSGGSSVTWLEINGPAASWHALTRLLSRAP
jgi:hypothetical protein